MAKTAGVRGTGLAGGAELDFMFSLYIRDGYIVKWNKIVVDENDLTV